MLNQILLFGLLLGLFGAYVLSNRRKIADGMALWWATVSEPIFYVSGDPFDETVSQRAANARALLETHGNGYLKYNSPDPKDDDVWEYVYSATPETTTRDFSQWQDWVLLDVIKRREAWRQKKAEYNLNAAKQRFAGQTITQPSAN